MRRILDHVPSKRQTLFFSATMPNEIRTLAVKILKDPETVQIGTIAPAKTVSHSLYPVPDKKKRDLLVALLQQTPTGRALVFTRTKHRARTLALELAKHSFRVAALQGNMSQNARQQAMDGFRAGKFDIMVATDIAAHGIDVPEVSHVINFDFPNTADTYLHRIGRTGRAEQTGEAFTLAGADDANMVREVERELGVKIERKRLEGFDYGNFTPEEQFREERMGLRRAGGQSNGGRAGRSTRDPGPRTGQNNGQNNRRRNNGSWNNGARPDRSPDARPRTDSNNENRSDQPAGATPQGGSDNGRRTEQPVGLNARPGYAGRRRSPQPLGRAPRSESPNGRSSGQILGRPQATETEDRRRSGQVLGRSTSPDASNGRTRRPKQSAPSFHPRPARPGRPGKPGSRPAARR